MINLVFVYDVEKRKTVQAKPEHRLSEYRQAISNMMDSVIGQSGSRSRRFRRQFDSNEVGLCLVDRVAATCIIVSAPANETQECLMIEFLNLIAAKVRIQKKLESSRELKTYLKKNVGEYTRKLNLAKLFPDREASFGEGILEEARAWRELAKEQPGVLIEAKKRPKANSAGGVAGYKWWIYGGIALVLLLIAYWLYAHVISKLL